MESPISVELTQPVTCQRSAKYIEENGKQKTQWVKQASSRTRMGNDGGNALALELRAILACKPIKPSASISGPEMLEPESLAYMFRAALATA